MYDLNAQSWRPHARRRAVLHDYEPGADDFLEAALAGLGGPEKSLPCRFLYDARGSALFDRICRLPEYYPTRTELGILEDNASEIADWLGPNVQLVELGSGSSVKVRILLDALATPETYVPIDISREHLMEAAQAVQDDYPELRVEAICADFAQDFELPPVGRGRRVGFYPGSTIGNLTPDEARAFLSLWSRRLGQGALFLVGVDLRKAPGILEPAYDDAQGVTAAFSLNLLRRSNRELGADFDPVQFRHEARYLADEGRVAIHLVSRTDQTVRIGGRSFAFRAGERVHIEDSWKYSLDGFRRLAREGGFEPLEVWTDAERLFSVHLLEAIA